MTTSTPAGWYADPNGQGQRYWDGGQWTEHQAVATPAAPAGYAPAPGYAPAQQGGTSGLVVAGYICAILIPIAGLVIGIVALTKRDDPRVGQHGLWIIIASVVAFVLWLAIMSAGGGSTY